MAQIQRRPIIRYAVKFEKVDALIYGVSRPKEIKAIAFTVKGWRKRHSRVIISLSEMWRVRDNMDRFVEILNQIIDHEYAHVYEPVRYYKHNLAWAFHCAGALSRGHRVTGWNIRRAIRQRVNISILP